MKRKTKYYSSKGKFIMCRVTVYLKEKIIRCQTIFPRSDAKKFAENVCRFRPLKNPYVLESDHSGLVAWPA